MFDAHCHLEYMEEPESVIKEAKTRMHGLVTSCASTAHMDITMKLAGDNPDFVYASLGLHPESTLVKEELIRQYMDFIRENSRKIAAVGETGLDYHWAKTEEKRKHTIAIFE